jgi:hypothetical protein
MVGSAYTKEKAVFSLFATILSRDAGAPIKMTIIRIQRIELKMMQVNINQKTS